MKYVLIIPVLMLFVGQVPFLKHMEKRMTETMQQEAMTKQSCCKKKKAENSSCHKPEHSASKKSEDGCCQKPEARCACVCCFSLAPVAEFSSLHKFFESDNEKCGPDLSEGLIFQAYPVLSPPPDALIS